MIRRRVANRLRGVLARLDGAHPEREAMGLDPLLDQLDRTVAATMTDLDRAYAARTRLAGALDHVGDGVVIVDENGIEVHRNSVAQTFAGARHADALVERAVRELLVESADGVSRRRNLDVFGPPRRMLVITTLPLDDGSRPVGTLAVIEDISERRHLEAVRRDFVANISHELKTPVGALGLLAETIASEENADLVRRLAERMTGEAMRVGRIIDDLLALSRIEAEEHLSVREPVHVSHLVAEALDRVRSLADAGGMHIDTSGVGARHTIGADERQLVSAIANLVENACKYSDPGSTVEISSSTDGRTVAIAVVDHGIGIPTSDLERVFERFYRVDRARSRETGGTGLGLAIVRHIAGNHHGEVTVTSEEGVGSTFTLRLPAGPGPVAVSNVGAPQPPREAESA
ncbi:MAG TPA: ATP-binding protein [Acidimicrobiales bacterium]|jgi:two-component system sensor histidine kinase SenX3